MIRARRWRLGAAAVVVAVLALAGVALALGRSPAPRPASASAPRPQPAARVARARVLAPDLRPQPHLVQPAAGTLAAGDAASAGDQGSADGGPAPAPQGAASNVAGPSAGAPTDAEIRKELADERRHLADFKRFLASGDSGSFLPIGPRARVLSDGRAVAPADAPDAVKQIIKAGNAIAKLPYIWGGGHGRWRDRGYDCSGSISFALASAGLLRAPMTSGDFMRWGDSGPGRWVTIFANGGHVYMYVAGLRFDTSGLRSGGTRWVQAGRSNAGFAEVHPPGL